MATINQSSKVLLVTKKPATIESTKETFENEKNIKIIDGKITSKNLFSFIKKNQPDIILLDYEFQKKSLDLIEKINSNFSEPAVIVLLPESGNIDTEQVLQSGAFDVVRYPYQPDDLMSSVTRLIDQMDKSMPVSSQEISKSEIGKSTNTFMVFSPKGGVGTTTISTNLAISLHKKLKQDVLLIDGKHLFGHVALFFNIRTGNSITDLITHAGNLDEQLIKQVVVRHASGIYVLPSPNSILEGQGIKPDSLFKVIQSLQMVFPNIIIDGGNSLDENTVTYMDSSDRILVVLNPEIASMRDARQFLDVSTTTLSYPNDKTILILNLMGRKSDVRSQEIEKILNKKIFGKLPADDNLALTSLNEGIPIILKKPNHPISKAINEISRELEKQMKNSRVG